MKIPKKITPDTIKDSIIEFRYSSKIPFEVAIGMFYKSLDETYIYTNRPISKQIPGLSTTNPLEIQIGSRPLFYNDKIKIELQPNSIIFNCLNAYISWDNYKIEIQKVLAQISKANVIDEYVRIGVRYINELANTDLKKCIKFSFNFGVPEIKSETYSFHSEFKQDNIRIILNLTNNLSVPSLKHASNQITTALVSNIDIDVIMESFADKSLESLLAKVETAHLKEKEIYFTLLSDEFLDSLNPIY